MLFNSRGLKSAGLADRRELVGFGEARYLFCLSFM